MKTARDKAVAAVIDVAADRGIDIDSIDASVLVDEALHAAKTGSARASTVRLNMRNIELHCAFKLAVGKERMRKRQRRQ